ncbi:hypothetical protein DFJ63DRAFT_333046 [Scheffersomyces coipomensis]|uniref:uncharacterized protein n=1 Tax=Scheffersomyces coipomensis TaxID=1788519 RepID=UPI00315CE0FA
MIIGLSRTRLLASSYTARSILLRPSFPSVRYLQQQSTDNNFLYINNFQQLQTKISDIHDTINETNIIDALKSCKTIYTQYPIQQKLEPNSKLIRGTNEIIDTIFNHDNNNIPFSQSLLKQILLLNLPTISNLKLINLYYDKNPSKSTIIDKSTALIALRNAINNAEFERAIKVSDITVGHPNYIEHNNQILKSGLIRLIGTSLAITIMSKFGANFLIEVGELSSGWRHLGSLNSMILTYFLNSSFFITIVRVGRQLISSGGDYLTWQKGTFYTHWFKHADEMLFCSKIVEADRELNGGENNPALIHELCRENDDTITLQHTLQPGYTRDGQKIRLLEAKDNLEDIRMQAYWMSGGDGFEWVEPDQDPAEIIWKDHLSQYTNPTIDSDNNTNNDRSLKWADDLIDSK